MSKLLKMLFALMCVGGLTFTVVGCEDDGPAEEMGEGIDETGENIEDATEDAGDDIEDAFDN